MIDLSSQTASTNLPQWLGGGEVKLNNIGKINIIFGPNGSGKSVVLRQLFGEMPDKYHLVSPERPGEFSYNPSYATEEEQGQTRHQSRLKSMTPDYRQRVISRLAAYLKRRGALRQPPDDTYLEKISEFMSVLLPDYLVEYIGQANRDFSIKRLSDNSEAGAESMSSGEADLLSVGLDAISICLMWKMSNVDSPILFLDEPNLHLHPDLDERLAMGIQRLVEDYDITVFIASHSTSLLSAVINSSGDLARLFYIKRGPGELSGRAPSDEIKQLSTILGGNTIMGSLFGVPLVLVEGDDDFEVWNQTVRSSKSKDARLCILPASGGKPEQDKAKTALETLFNSLGMNRVMGYSLKDGDTADTGRNQSEKNPRIKRIWLSCREVENLYLTSEVLEALGENLEEARTKLQASAIPDADVQSIFDDRKNSPKVKEHIAIITATLGHPLERWQTKIGKVMGVKKPEGELADFIGQEVMEAFWTST